MLSPSSSAGSDPIAERAATAPDESAGPSSPEVPLSDGWPSIALGIILAGWAYPVALASIYVAVGLVVTFGRELGSNSNLWVPITFLFSGFLMLGYTLFIGMIGMMWTGFVTLLTLPIVHAFFWTLKLRVGIVWLGAISGGLVGFVAVFPMIARLPANIGAQDPWIVLVALAAGPGATTILGQIGGAWGGRRAVQRVVSKAERHAALVAIGWRTDPPRTEEVVAPKHDASVTRYQFRLRHLLWLCVWLSLLLSAIRLSGIPFEFVLPLLLGWLAYQAATLYVGRIFCRRFVPGRPSDRPVRFT